MSYSLTQKKSKKVDLGRVKDGTKPAILVQIVGLGEHKKLNWQTQEVETWDDGNPIIQDKLLFVYEFPTELIEVEGDFKGQPFWLYKEYPYSTHEKSGLMQASKSLDPNGKASDVEDLIGSQCLVQVGSTSGGNAKVAAVMSMPDGFPEHNVYNEDKVLTFDFYNPDSAVFEKLPNWIQDKIKDAENYNGDS